MRNFAVQKVCKMDDIVYFDTVSQYNDFYSNETLHPLVNIIDYSKGEKRKYFTMRLNFYAIMLKDVKCGDMKYGRNSYDYQEDTLVFLAPGQVVRFVASDEEYKPKGKALIFHADILRDTNLGKLIKEYSFFDYSVSEALHVSKAERNLIIDFFQKIEFELKNNIDLHSRQLIVSNIELFLNYCRRFYDRQFISREIPNKGIMEDFERLLKNYYNDEPQEVTLPTVAYFAEQLNISANYFGDLVKKSTGQSAHEYILTQIAEIAKTKIWDTRKSIKQISYELGFKYPQHFIRFFRTRTSQTPNEYRSLN